MTEPAIRETTVTPERVWEVLADGWSFPSWVVGAARVRAVDPRWPEVGARIHHSVGLWPLLLDDETEVMDASPAHKLRLHARAWPFGLAEVEVRLRGDAAGSRIEMTEHAISRPTRWIPRVIQARAVMPRNRECLRRLALIAERATDSAEPTS
jgi:hypothetical protein